MQFESAGHCVRRFGGVATSTSQGLAVDFNHSSIWNDELRQSVPILKAARRSPTVASRSLRKAATSLTVNTFVQRSTVLGPLVFGLTRTGLP